LSPGGVRASRVLAFPGGTTYLSVSYLSALRLEGAWFGQ